MKLISGIILSVIIAISFSSCSMFGGKAKIETELDSVSYLIGANIGNNINMQFKQAGLDTLLDKDLIMSAIQDVLDSSELVLDPIEGQVFLNMYFMRRQDEMIEKQFGHNRIEGEAFLEENKKRPEVTELPSGLQYEILVQGEGKKPIPGQKVTAHYHGTFLDGSVFDSSIDKGKPFSFIVGGNVMQAWNEIAPMMNVGSKWKIYVPYDLAYGKNGYGMIEPYKTLIFEMEILGIEEIK